MASTETTENIQRSDQDDTQVRWGDGAAIGASPFRQLVGAADTEGRLVVLAVDMPGRLHVDEHTHVHEDQITVVMSGRIGASVGEQRFVVEQGGVVFLPRGVPHAQWNLGDTDARLLEIYTPSGMEEVFAKAPPVSV